MSPPDEMLRWVYVHADGTVRYKRRGHERACNETIHAEAAKIIAEAFMSGTTIFNQNSPGFSHDR